MIQWINSEIDRFPIESDGIIIIMNANGFAELVYLEGQSILKPWKFDDNDIPAIRDISDIKFWSSVNDPKLISD
jgi:hypothetical protein